MIENAKNKAIEENPTKKEFHFAGSGKYKPITIPASDYNEAYELWLKKRELVQPLKSE